MQNRSLCLFYLLVLILVCGCGNQNATHNDSEIRKSQLEEQRRQDQKVIEQLMEKTGAVYFPPSGSNSFTYDLQSFIKKNKDKPLIFRGYLEDILYEDEKVYAEFICPLMDYYYFNKKGIKFKILIKDTFLPFFLEERENTSSPYLPIMQRIKYLSDPNFFIVVKVNDFKRASSYIIESENIDSDEPSFTVFNVLSYIATGTLVDGAKAISRN
jgi:hypothetical protein